jgi:HK97 gp10 family phage protein
MARDKRFLRGSPGFQRIQAAANEVQTNAPRVLRAAALILERAAKLQLSHPGTGRIYRRGTTAIHQASAPGEPPAVDTGNLRNSVGSEVLGNVVRVGAAADYAAGLEFGTDRVAARPWLRPAFAEVREQLQAVVIGELRRGPSGGF